MIYRFPAGSFNSEKLTYNLVSKYAYNEMYSNAFFTKGAVNCNIVTSLTQHQ